MVKRSIFKKLLVAMVGLIIVLLTVLTLIQIAFQKELFERELEKRIVLMKEKLVDRGRILSASLLGQVENGIASVNLSFVSELLRNSVRDNQELDYIILMHTSGRAYIHTLKPQFELKQLNEPEDLFAASQTQATVNEYRRDGKAFIEFIMPVKVSVEPWGVLRLGFGLDNLNREIVSSRQESKAQIQDMVVRSLAIAVIIILVGAGTVLIISERLSRPLLHLTRWANKLAQGDFALSDKVKIKTGGEIGALAAAFSQMTLNLKKSYAALEEYNRTLEEKVEQRTHELAEARDQAVAANNSKSDFLSMMSHEIRTPMSAILGMTLLALQTELTSKQRDYLAKVQISAHALLEIINDILDYSKIEAGKLELENTAFNLNDVLSNLSSLMSVKAEEKSLQLHFVTACDVPLHLQGDPLRLSQVLLNLMSNAIKFTDYGEIVIRTDLAEQSQHGDRIKLRFSVKDTGIGLTEEQIGKLFQSFSQADNSITRKYGGTGLGLAICKRMVELMGGDIQVDSTFGQGSTFSFSAQFGHYQTNKPLGLKLYADTFKGMKALVVDDNETSRTVLRSYLESFNFEVSQAGSGEQAIRLLEEASQDQPYRLMLIDWKLPKMDGIAAVRQVRDNPKIIRPPYIIMVTAYSRGEVMQLVSNAALDGFLMKPVHPSVLYDAIANTFGYNDSDDSGYSVPTADTWRIDNASMSFKGAKLLLVEDIAINQQVAKELLEQADFIVSLAADGAEAVRKIHEDLYDAVLMDLQMPKMDGYEAATIIRAEPRFKELPIIAMTAHVMADVKEKCLAAGMNGYVTKPIDVDELFATLRASLKQKENDVTLASKTQSDSRNREDHKVRINDLPGIDWQRGLKNAAGNKTLFQQLLVQFKQNFNDTRPRLERLLSDGDLESAQTLLHALKGVAANLSMPALTSRTAAVEQRLGQTGTCDPVLLAEFFAELEQVLTGLEKLPSADKPTQAVIGFDKKRLKSTLNRLLAALVDHSLDADDEFRVLQQAMPANNEDFKRLAQAIDRFDFDAARAAVQKIAQQYSGEILQPEPVNRNSANRNTLLIVDDMPINVRTLGEALKHDYTVKVATDGATALTLARSAPLDLILLDIEMPGLNGRQVCRQLKENIDTEAIPVIFITGRDEAQDEAIGFELGAVDYISRPFNIAVVQARIKTHLELKKQRDLLAQIATLDALTGIPNRRMFDEFFDREWHRAKRLRTELSVIFIDVDVFKFFNDNYGHAAGDECLKNVAEVLKSSLKRASDFIARYGGEEFVAVLPETGAQDAAHIAEVMRNNMENLNIPHAFSDVADCITLSLGVSSMVPNMEMDPETLLRSADEALYLAKENGRNQVGVNSMPMTT